MGVTAEPKQYKCPLHTRSIKTQQLLHSSLFLSCDCEVTGFDTNLVSQFELMLFVLCELHTAHAQRITHRR